MSSKKVVQFHLRTVDTHDLLRRFEFEELHDKVKGFYLGYLDSCPDFVPTEQDEVATNAEGVGVVLTHKNHEYAVKIPGPDGKSKFKLIRKSGLGLSVSGLLKYLSAEEFESKKYMLAANVAKKNTCEVERITASQRSLPAEQRHSQESLKRMFPTTVDTVTSTWSGSSVFGTKCHKLCEDWYRGIIRDFTDPRMQEHEVAHEMRMFAKFVEKPQFPGMDDRPFARDKLFMTEASMAFLPLLITGQCDLVLKINVENGITWVRLLDYKFTKNMDQSIKPDADFKSNFPDYRLTKMSKYYIQLNLYKAMLEYFYPNVRVRDMFIVNIDPSFCPDAVGKKHHEPQIVHVPHYPDVVKYIMRRRQAEILAHIDKRSSFLNEDAPAKRSRVDTPGESEKDGFIARVLSRDDWERGGERGQWEGSSSATSSASSTRRGPKLESVHKLVTAHLPTL